MENELVAVDDSTAPSLANQFDIVDVEAAAAFMENYQDLVKRLLDKTDYQRVGDKHLKKKSAWRKLATAFNISDDIIEEEIIRDECHRIISAKFVVRATLPNGRYGMGIGDCSIFDKVKKDDEKEPTPFELRKRFSNAEHDIIGTAHTRAKSRAISDLIGSGEVSAEEMSATGKPKKPVRPMKPQSKVPNTSTMGNKPKAPKAPSKPKLDDEAIEVTPKEVKDTPKTSGMSLKEIIDSNPTIRLAVDELQASGSTPNRDTIKAKLLDLNEMGKVTTDEYKECKALLE